MTGRGRRTGLYAVLAALLTAGCGDRAGGDTAAAAPEQPAVRDSAGVRIVENGAAPNGRWSVSAAPIFRVGWDESGPLFTWVQSGRILPDGGALVAEQSNGTIYRLAADGSAVDSLGGKGQGPGEFDRLDGMVLKGDSVVVSDNRLMRLTFIGPDGAVRTKRVPGGSQRPVLSALAPDGRVLFVQGDGYGGPPEGKSGWVFEEEPILLLDAAAAQVDTLATLPHIRLWYEGRGGSPGPLHAKGRAGGFDGGFAWARSDRTAVHWYDWDGHLVQRATWNEAPVPLDADRRRQLVEQYRAAWSGNDWDAPMINRQLERLEADLDRYDLPLPYWDHLHVDRGGNVWLSRYPPPFSWSEDWQVITRDGEHVGTVHVPGMIRPLDITDDRLLGVVMDEFNVPAVTMWELVKR